MEIITDPNIIAVFGTLAGTLLGTLGTIYITNRQIEIEEKRRKEDRHLESKKEVYAEFLSFLFEDIKENPKKAVYALLKAQMFADKQLKAKLRKALSAVMDNDWQGKYGMNVNDGVDDLISEIKKELNLI